MLYFSTLILKCPKLAFYSNESNLLFLTCQHSVLGGILIIAGLYIVTWASFREKQAALGIIPHVSRSSEPLTHKDVLVNRIPFQRGHIFSGTSNILPKPSD